MMIKIAEIKVIKIMKIEIILPPALMTNDLV